MMRIMLTGGAGFIGSNVAKCLFSLGHEIVCVDKLLHGSWRIQSLIGQTGFTLYAIDLCNETELSNVFSKEPIDYVMHLAANSDIQISSKNPNNEYYNTYLTTKSILENMKKYGVKRLFYASTSAVYGDYGNQVIDENYVLCPISYYGAAKMGAEGLIHAYSYMNNFSSLIYRFSNIVGPSMTHGVIYDFFNKLKNNRRVLEILGDGKQTKPYLYIDDLVSGIVLGMALQANGVHIFNIGSDSSTSVIHIADMLVRQLHLCDVTYCYTGGERGWRGDIPVYHLNNAKLTAMGWCAKYNSDQAVQVAIQKMVLS